MFGPSRPTRMPNSSASCRRSGSFMPSSDIRGCVWYFVTHQELGCAYFSCQSSGFSAEALRIQRLSFYETPPRFLGAQLIDSITERVRNRDFLHERYAIPVREAFQCAGADWRFPTAFFGRAPGPVTRDRRLSKPSSPLSHGNQGGFVAQQAANSTAAAKRSETIAALRSVFRRGCLTWLIPARP